MKKTAFLLMLTFILFSCKKDKKKGVNNKPVDFETEVVTLDSSNLKACQNAPCPKIEVSYLKFEGDSDFSENINTQNENDLINLFHIDEDSAKSNKVSEGVNAFANDYFRFKSDYPESSEEYEAKVSQEIKSQNKRTIVLKTTFYLFTGGAHGYGGVHFLNFDAHSGKYLTHKELISNISAFTDFVEEKFRVQYQIPPNADINSKGFFFDDGKFALPKNIAVTDKKVVLLYNPYEAASYAEGQLRFVFPKKEVEQWLNY